jgi:hypothetical protein
MRKSRGNALRDWVPCPMRRRERANVVVHPKGAVESWQRGNE